ncbi:MAG: TIGR04282 family arsenosugar biosynthesis glycosyltransferase, partial [Planctomycetota bacterium]
MRQGANIAAVIPALNEEASIAKVLGAIPPWVDDVVVVDNGSSDGTAEEAGKRGARVVAESRRGYGTACLKGIAALADPDVVVFLDADFSDDPSEMARVVDPILDGRAELVVGSRTRGKREAGALTPQARFGNALAVRLIRFFWRVRFTDLGPFRAVSFRALERLGMADPDFGWTVEMQIKAARTGLRILEVPVSYRRRVGVSKISGTLRGVVGAGWKILSTIFREALGPKLTPPDSPARRLRCIVFTRAPRPGETKTRLIPALGPEGAAEVHRRLTEDMVGRVRALRASLGAGVELRHAGGNPRRLSEWLGGDLFYRPQEGADLGERMDGAFRTAFREGAERVILVGTDAPGLTPSLMEEGFRALEGADLVLGPAVDGGYTLIGLRAPRPELFRSIPWGTSEVLGKTLSAARSADLRVALLPELGDVDRPADLALLPWPPPPRTDREPKISVIIPTVDEEETLAATFEVLRWEEIEEVVVADGGSRDGTPALARAFGAKLIRAGPTRAARLNAGAEVSTGDILLFLHADTQLPSGFRERVARVMGRRNGVAGAFRLKIDTASPACRLVEAWVDLRTRLFGMPYGDQAIFLRADRFRAMGGFPALPIMEDFVFAA